MAARIPGTPFAEELYEAVEPHAFDDEAQGWALWTLCQAIARPLDLVDELVRAQDDREAWTVALDVDRTPAIMLPWLALFIGDRLPAGLSEQASRDRVKDVRGFRRGTPATIAAAAGDTLTGTKLVRLVERNEGNAYWLLVITKTSETPDPAVTEAAIISQKPAGIRMEYFTDDLPLIDEGTETIDGSSGNINTATLADVTI